jgi:hypothetical protein
MTRGLGNSGNRTTGEAHHRAKLSDADVARMRRMYRPGIVSMPLLAREFGCGVSTVRDIVQYRTRP